MTWVSCFVVPLLFLIVNLFWGGIRVALAPYAPALVAQIDDAFGYNTPKRRPRKQQAEQSPKIELIEDDEDEKVDDKVKSN